MKHLILIAMVLTTGCEDPSRSSPKAEAEFPKADPIKAESPKSEYLLPDGTRLYCEDHRVWDAQMDLEGCVSAHRTVKFKKVRCAHGVCWVIK